MSMLQPGHNTVASPEPSNVLLMTTSTASQLKEVILLCLLKWYHPKFQASFFNFMSHMVQKGNKTTQKSCWLFLCG